MVLWMAQWLKYLLLTYRTWRFYSCSLQTISFKFPQSLLFWRLMLGLSLGVRSCDYFSENCWLLIIPDIVILFPLLKYLRESFFCWLLIILLSWSCWTCFICKVNFSKISLSSDHLNRLVVSKILCRRLFVEYHRRLFLRDISSNFGKIFV